MGFPLSFTTLMINLFQFGLLIMISLFIFFILLLLRVFGFRQIMFSWGTSFEHHIMYSKSKKIKFTPRLSFYFPRDKLSTDWKSIKYLLLKL